MDGKLRFQLPGEPLFPALGDGSILRPTLGWQIRSQTDAKFDAQLSYLSQGFNWEADYNLVAPEKGETVTLTGWVTVNNHSGTAFNQATVKLVAGDVNIIEPDIRTAGRVDDRLRKMDELKTPAGVQEKAFDDFHLYTLQRPLTIRDKEIKQVEFLRVLVLGQVVLARVGAQEPVGDLVGLLDERPELLRSLQIDGHTRTAPSMTPMARRSRYQRSTGCSLT